MALLASTLITDLQDQIGTLDATGQGVLLKFIQRALDRIYQYRRWSWRRHTDQFTTLAPYETGTVTVSAGSTAVTGSGTTWTDITGYNSGTFYIKLNSELHQIASITDATHLVLSAGVDTAVSASSYTIYCPVVELDVTLAELTHIGTYLNPRIDIASPGWNYEVFWGDDSRSYAQKAALTGLGPNKGRQIVLWPYPSERQVYQYEGFIAAPTLVTTTDVGCPDDFRDAIEEMTLSLWYRRRDNDMALSQACYAAGKARLDELWLADPKDTSAIPFRGATTGSRGFQWEGAFWQ